jgi:cell division protein FtsL
VIVFCYPLLHPPIAQASSHAAAGSIWAVDVPTWITAIATLGLLIGAIITAMFAARAFSKQAEELENQREVNELQTKDLEESLKERERLRQVAQREQADAVNFAWWPASHVLIIRHPPADTPAMSVLVVDNASRHRIMDAACRLEPSEGTGLTLAAEQVGQLTTGLQTDGRRATLNQPADGSMVPLIRPGSQYGFLLRFDLETHPGTRLAARFTDDAGLHWQIDQDLHLQPLDNRDDW